MKYIIINENIQALRPAFIKKLSTRTYCPWNSNGKFRKCRQRVGAKKSIIPPIKTIPKTI